MTKPTAHAQRSAALLLDPLPAVASTRVFGLDARERLRRSCAALGLEVLAGDGLSAFHSDPAQDGNLAPAPGGLADPRPGGPVDPAPGGPSGAIRGGAERGARRIVALRTSHFFDDRVIAARAAHAGHGLLLVAPGPAETAADPATSQAVGLVGEAASIGPWIDRLKTGELPPDSARAAGFAVVSAGDLVPAFDAKLRKHSPPFVVPAAPERTRELEDTIFAASYKGATDFVTKWLWPRPAQAATSWCAQRGIPPNSVTALSYVLTAVALVAFWQGAFEGGLVAAWIMTFLDTVDGKLARVTLTTSRIGDVLDHGLDLVHPPLWWAAWGAGLTGLAQGTNAASGAGLIWGRTPFGEFEIWVAIVVVGYVVGRLLEGLFIVAFGQEMFTWRPFDSGFRLVIARRNPNLVLLTGSTLAGRPDLGLIAVGSWTLCCIGIQLVRIAQAALHRLRGRPITPHAESPDGPH